MTCVIVDTNVILVANGQHPDVSPECVIACTLRLQEIVRTGRLALDDRFLILLEYQNKTTPRQGRGPGDAFVRWALQNNANSVRVVRVPLVDDELRGFASFPDHPVLVSFDPPDRKFVAVACAHGASPPILQATDSKWLGWDAALKAHGVTVHFLCPEDIKKFATNKNGK